MDEESRILCCSDIHGHPRALERVLAGAGWRPGVDPLVLLGDYVDRGPSPRETVARLRTLLRCPGVVALRGNHEEMLSQYLRGEISAARYLANGGETTLEDYSGDGDALARDADFLSDLPIHHETADYIFVHGGLVPGVPLESQRERDMLWIRGDFIRDYRGKLVVFGHTPTTSIRGDWEIYFGEDKIGIDTGVAYGGYLSLLELPSGRVHRARGDNVESGGEI